MPRHALAERPTGKAALENLEKVVVSGNLADLTVNERIGYYARVCESLGLNPLTHPFEYMTLNGRLILYARKDATDQLRRVNGISVTGIRREADEDLGLQIVTVEGRDRDGRTDSSIGVVSTKGLAGESLANALMKAETKAKRRMTLSLAGLGWLDETEIASATDEPVARTSLIEAIEARTEELSAPAPEPEPEPEPEPPSDPSEPEPAAVAQQATLLPDEEDDLPEIPEVVLDD